MMKKIFFVFLILCFFAVSVNALVVEDISQKIDSGNTAIQKANAELTAQVSQLKEQTATLRTEIQDLKSEMVLKSDLPQIYGTFEALQRQSNANMLVIMLVFMAFLIAVQLILKIKRVL